MIQGLSYRNIGNYQQALKNYKQSYKIYEKFNNKINMGRTLGAIGNYFLNLGTYFYSGNVGIGITEPSSALHVVGNQTSFTNGFEQDEGIFIKRIFFSYSVSLLLDCATYGFGTTLIFFNVSWGLFPAITVTKFLSLIVDPLGLSIDW